MSLLQDTVERKVEKAYLSNLATGTTLPFLINPAQLQEAYEAVYARLNSPGLSHRRLHYVGNENARLSFTATYDELLLREQVTKDVFAGLPTRTALGWRAYLQSLLYPRRGQSLSAASPPPVLFSWPGMISMRVRVIRLSFTHTMFQSGRPLPRIYTVRMELEEEPLERIYSDDLLRHGTIRPWAADARERRR